MMWFRRRGARRSDERGAAAVEFAIIMPLLSILLMGIIEYGYFFYVAQSANSAAREVARQMSVGNCTNGTSTSGEPYNLAQAQGALPSLTVHWGDPSSGLTDPNLTTGDTFPGIGETLEVQVTANALILNFIPVPNNGVVTRSVKVYVEDTTVGTCPA